MVVHISSRVSASLLSLVSSGVGDRALMLTMVDSGQGYEWRVIVSKDIVMKRVWPGLVLLEPHSGRHYSSKKVHVYMVSLKWQGILSDLSRCKIIIGWLGLTHDNENLCMVMLWWFYRTCSHEVKGYVYKHYALGGTSKLWYLFSIRRNIYRGFWS